MIRQSDDAGTNDAGTNDDLVSRLGSEITVTLDRWSAGQLGIEDLVISGVVVLVGGLAAWAVSGIARRVSRRYDGVARTAIATGGLLAGSSVALLALALCLEVLGFGIGPILVLVLLVVAGVLLLRPLMTNLSSGLLLQLRGALAPGDLILTDEVLGVVHEINARAVVLDTSDGRRVHVPNSQVLANKVENYSKIGRRRSDFSLAIDSSADRERAMVVIHEAVRDREGVFHDPPPEVRVVGVLGTSLVIRVMVWHEPTLERARAVVDECLRSAVAACESEGIDPTGPHWVAVADHVGGRFPP